MDTLHLYITSYLILRTYIFAVGVRCVSAM